MQRTITDTVTIADRKEKRRAYMREYMREYNKKRMSAEQRTKDAIAYLEKQGYKIARGGAE